MDYIPLWLHTFCCTVPDHKQVLTHSEVSRTHAAPVASGIATGIYDPCDHGVVDVTTLLGIFALVLSSGKQSLVTLPTITIAAWGYLQPGLVSIHLETPLSDPIAAQLTLSALDRLPVGPWLLGQQSENAALRALQIY